MRRASLAPIDDAMAHVRNILMQVLPALAGACLLFTVISARFALDVAPSNGMLWSVREGRVRWYCWDTSRWRIDYPRGVSFESQPWHIELWPFMHLGGPSANQGPGAGQWVIAIPLWMAALTMMAAWWLVRPTRWPRKGWQCIACGYDLRGVRAAGRCPEYGRMVPSINSTGPN